MPDRNERGTPAGGRPWVLAETAWKVVRETAYDVAVLPWGSTEAHNYHLPYATDVLETTHIAEAAARQAWERGAKVVVLPPVPYGVQTGQLDIPFCINLNPTTQFAVLRDVVDSLAPHVRRLVILNGHGGNDFKWMIRELQPRTSLFICLVNWYAMLDPRPFFDQPGDHAGELETSVMMHVTPDLVLPLDVAGNGAERRFRITGLREGWAWAPRQWTQISEDTGVGDPAAATAAKGERYFRAVVDRTAAFLAELAAADPADLLDPRGT